MHNSDILSCISTFHPLGPSWSLTQQVDHFAIEYSGAEQQLLERVAKKYQLTTPPTRASCEASGDYDQVSWALADSAFTVTTAFARSLHLRVPAVLYFCH